MCDAEGEVGVVNGPVGGEDEEPVLASGGGGDGEEGVSMLPVGGGAAAEDEAGELVGGPSEVAGREDQPEGAVEYHEESMVVKPHAARSFGVASGLVAARLESAKQVDGGPAILKPPPTSVLRAAYGANMSSDDSNSKEDDDEDDDEYTPQSVSTAEKRRTVAKLQTQVGTMEGMMEVAAAGLPVAVMELYEQAKTDASIVETSNAVTAIYSALNGDGVDKEMVAGFMDECVKAYYPCRVALDDCVSVVKKKKNEEPATMPEKRAKIRRLEAEIEKDVAATEAKRRVTEDRKKKAALLEMEHAKAEAIRKGKKNRSVASVFGSPASSK
jgi:hypothetical protein